eukprot:6455414-Amphidinium_carterae.1
MRTSSLSCGVKEGVQDSASLAHSLIACVVLLVRTMRQEFEHADSHASLASKEAEVVSSSALRNHSV